MNIFCSILDVVHRLQACSCLRVLEVKPSANPTPPTGAELL